VLVEGALFYDNEHEVRVADERRLRNQPRRMSLWEIHPVTDFFVCGRADKNCAPRLSGDWVKLEDLPERERE
jgi:hypothetical protein